MIISEFFINKHQAVSEWIKELKIKQCNVGDGHFRIKSTNSIFATLEESCKIESKCFAIDFKHTNIYFRKRERERDFVYNTRYIIRETAFRSFIWCICLVTGQCWSLTRSTVFPSHIHMYIHQFLHFYRIVYSTS